MDREQYIERLAHSLQRNFSERAAKYVAEYIMDEWLWEAIEKDAIDAANRVKDYSYGGTHRHPLDMD